MLPRSLARRAAATRRTLSTAKPPAPRPHTLAAVGVTAGALGSLAGMGGGFIAIPLMTRLGVSQHAAHGTSLVGVVCTGAAGAAAYAADGAVDVKTAACVAATGALTAAAGARAAASLSAATLSRALGAFMLAVAPIVPFRDKILDAIGAAGRTQKGDDPVREIVPLLGVGVAAGFLAGLFGVGGGAVVVPLLALATDLDHKTALGTSLCAMVPTGIAGVLAHRRLGHVKLAAAAPLALGTCIGAFAGGRLALGLDEEPMRLGFGAVMVALGVKTLLKKP